MSEAKIEIDIDLSEVDAKVRNIVEWAKKEAIREREREDRERAIENRVNRISRVLESSDCAWTKYGTDTLRQLAERIERTLRETD